MDKKRRFPILLILLSLSAALCVTVFAYMFRQTEPVENQFTPAKVDCTVVEEFNDNVKSSIQVQNTGNIDAYLRLRVISYWVNDKDEIVAKPSEFLDIQPANGWIEGRNNTYYYPTPVVPGGVTENLLGVSITLKESSEGYLQVIEVFAEAIQSLPAEAVENRWGVTLNTSGTIIAAH